MRSLFGCSCTHCWCFLIIDSCRYGGLLMVTVVFGLCSFMIMFSWRRRCSLLTLGPDRVPLSKDMVYYLSRLKAVLGSPLIFSTFWIIPACTALQVVNAWSVPSRYCILLVSRGGMREYYCEGLTRVLWLLTEEDFGLSDVSIHAKQRVAGFDSVTATMMLRDVTATFHTCLFWVDVPSTLQDYVE